jgi:predicted N-acetyltransferase YhbS
VVTIRPGTPADLAAVTEIYRAASLSNPSDRDALLAHPEYLVMGPEGLAGGRTQVAEEDGAVVGFATWAETHVGLDLMELEDLFVHPSLMRRGIATALVARIAEILRARGAQRLMVVAARDAAAFYRSVGFVECGTVETTLGPAPRMLLTIG